MRIVVIGAGMIGARHAAYFAQAGHQVSTVDQKAAADFDRLALVPDPAEVAAWVVATPTATHLPVLGEVLSYQRDARILLEKPACYPTEFADLTRLVRRYPRARIVVNDVYAYSAAVRRFTESVRQFRASDQIRKITIEFTKNRERDVANGRFVDTQYGEPGYEFFHMLSILRSVLPVDQYQTYLRTVPISVTPEMRVCTSIPGLPEVEIYASSKGVIGFADLAGFAFSGDIAKDHIHRALIPYGDELRYRFADVEFASGRHVTLVFEPHYGVAVDYKNEHAVHIRDAASQHRFTVSGNHFKEALLIQLDLLCRTAVSTPPLRLPEHQFMADLGGQFSKV
ncbi:Gfo/Idh/MocA family oxidoreductase [Nocardia sp. XZ_19_369]|uniref:Gfo/Idh/MocA family oxidoreductase n=1 Tax=Nocardia sp. XZ_19_369 TaxID=2769487 RepID=UPI00188FF51B|nr:Gfo/Idh/MocA family oxidoreductase [Nocardia sp. XZ_19_369]